MHALIEEAEDRPAVREPDLHLGRVDIDIQVGGRHGQVEDGKGKAVLHEVCAVTLLKARGELLAAQHPAIDKEGLKAPAGPAHLGLAQEAVQDHPRVRVFGVDRNDGSRRLPSVDPVDQLLKVPVSGRMQLVLAVDPVVEGDPGVGQGLFFDQVRDIAGFGLGLAEEPAADGDLAEEVAHDDGGPVGGSDLLQVDLDWGIRREGGQAVIESPGP